MRNYRREIALETRISYDAAALERGERTEIALEDNVLSRDYEGNMMTEIHALFYEGGELKMHYYYTIMGDKFYTLKKVDHGPFDHIKIRDDEFLERLQGTWIQWRKSGDTSTASAITIMGNTVKFPFGDGERFHVISRNYAPQQVFLVPENLIDGNFRGYTEIEVLPDMLTTTMMVCDASMPLEVYARRDMLDKIVPPARALEPMRNTMTPPTTNFGKPLMGFMGMGMGMGMNPLADPSAQQTAAGEPPADGEYPKYCPACGYELKERFNFCPECGTSLRK